MATEIRSIISKRRVTMIATGGTRAQRAGVIRAELVKWRPEKMRKDSVSYADTEVYHHPLTTVIEYVREDS